MRLFPQLALIPDQIKDIVLNLEGKANRSSVPFKRFKLCGIGRSDTPAGFKRKDDKVSGFVLMDIAKLLQFSNPLLALHIGNLSADHSCRSGVQRHILNYF
ncbi:hypothetical protein D3C73_1235510 [compost metagenome]